MTILSQIRAGSQVKGITSVIVDSLTAHKTHNPGPLVPAGVAKSIISMESIGAREVQEVGTALESMGVVLDRICMEQGIAKNITVQQREAALASAIVASDPRSFVTRKETGVVSTENMIVVSELPAQSMGVERRSMALESFDETDNRNLAQYSIAYNFQCAQQDEFGEAFFPTVVVSPDQAAYSIQARIVSLFTDARHDTNGSLIDFKRRNVIDAMVDPTLVQNDTTEIVPVYNTGSAASFVDSALVAPYDTVIAGENVTTAPLKIGKALNLIGLSQTDALLTTGILDVTDAIDSSVSLQALYVEVTDGTDSEALKFRVDRMPYNNFVANPQNNYRNLILTFKTDALAVKADTKLVDGSASVLLNSVQAAGLRFSLTVGISGDLQQDTGATNVFAANLSVYKVFNSSDVEMAPTSAEFLAVKAIVDSMKVVGYDLKLRRTNTNRRQVGQMLDVSYQGQTYPVPLLSPITVPRTVNSGDVNDNSDLNSLIMVTRLKTSIAAVDELLRFSEFLEGFDSVNNEAVGEYPAVAGVSRYLGIKPVHVGGEIKVDQTINSLTSKDRFDNIHSVIVNKLRDAAYRMYRDSHYKPAYDATLGGVAPMPTIIIGTDPVLARYLMVEGDTRLMGPEFDFKIVVTSNKRMAGKIVMSFGQFGEGAQGTPNPLHFGNMAWKPEITVSLPSTTRNGRVARELSVNPSFVHVVNLAVMALFTVTGVEEAVESKASINFHSV